MRSSFANPRGLLLRRGRAGIGRLLLFVLAGTLSVPGRAQTSSDPALEAWVNEMNDRMLRNATVTYQMAQAKLAEALERENRETEVCARIFVGLARRRMNYLQSALRDCTEALALAEELRLPGARNLALYAVATVHNAAGRPATALEFGQRALELARQRGAVRSEQAAHYVLGNAFAGLGDHLRARDAYTRALELAERLDDGELIWVAHSALAAEAEALRDPATARAHYARALAVGLAEKQTAMEMDDLRESLALLDAAEGRAEEALAAFDPILKRRRSLRSKRKLAVTLYLRAQVLQGLGRLDAALADASEACRHAEGIESHELRQEAFGVLAAVHEARGDPRSALEALRRHQAEREAGAGLAAQQRAVDLQTRFDVAAKERELARLVRDNEVQAADGRAKAALLAQNAAELKAKDAELRESRAQRLALAGGAAAIAMAAGTIVVALRARRRADRIALAETQAARHAAEEADALKTRLLGIASHDLKGPLRSMIRGAGRLEAAAADPAAVKSETQALKAQGERMFVLVRDLLDLAAIEGGGIRLQRAPLDLGALAAEIVSRHAARAEQKSQALICEPADATLPRVSADAARLAQALENLVDNAIKFTPAGGEIHVTVARRGADACVAVSDNGPGLGAEDLVRMFQPFQTLSGVPTGGESSAGLGLHIAREIVALHGGRVDVDSAPGAGATFTIALPISKTAALVPA